jgi:hypothetical protein
MLKQKEAKFGPVKDHGGASNSGVPDRFNTYNMPTLQANTATLKVILSNIVEWILKSGKKFYVLCLPLKIFSPNEKCRALELHGNRVRKFIYCTYVDLKICLGNKLSVP